MTKNISALTARTQFGQIMERARTKGERFVVSKNGDPTVVVLSIADYAANVLKKPASLALLQADARRRGVDQLTPATVNREITTYRKSRRRTAKL
jgi:prevent-host-death family protein